MNLRTLVRKCVKAVFDSPLQAILKSSKDLLKRHKKDYENFEKKVELTFKKLGDFEHEVNHTIDDNVYKSGKHILNETKIREKTKENLKSWDSFFSNYFKLNYLVETFEKDLKTGKKNKIELAKMAKEIEKKSRIMDLLKKDLSKGIQLSNKKIESLHNKFQKLKKKYSWIDL